MTGWDKLLNTENFLQSLSASEIAQSGTLKRVKGLVIYGAHKYITLGVRPLRNKAAILQYTPHVKKMSPQHWNTIHDNILLAESVAAAYLSTDELHRMNCAKALNNFPLIKSVNNDDTPCREAKMFGGLAFGRNVHLSCHKDADFNYSIAILLKTGHLCLMRDDIAGYFCFPSLGMCVPLCPGDILLFDPTFPHCISSRCYREDEVFCVTLYLKSAVVGLNDNYLELTPLQEALST